MIFRMMSSIAGALLAVGIFSQASAAPLVPVVCGSPGTSVNPIVLGAIYAGDVEGTGGGAGSCYVEFTHVPPPDPLGSGMIATVSAGVLSGWTGLSVAWESVVNGVLDSTPVVAPVTELATSFASPGDLVQRLVFSWTTSAPVGISFDFEVTAVPVPPALLLFGSALGGLGLLARRRRKSATAA